MSMPPAPAERGRRLAGRLRAAGRHGVLALGVTAILLLISLLGTLIPDGTVTLVWFVPMIDTASVVTMAVVLFLSSTDVLIRRTSRSLPIVFASVVIGLLWLLHMLTFPGILPFRLPFITDQTAALLFHAAHVGTPVLFAGILIRRGGPVVSPSRSLLRVIGLGVAVSLVSAAALGGLALLLPPLILKGRFTGFNTGLQALPFFAIAFAAATYRAGRYGDRRVENSVVAGLILVSFESLAFMFMRARYDSFWYGGHALAFLPGAALLLGTLGLYASAKREADIHLRLMEQFKQSQQHLQVIIDTSPSAVISADERGFITGWNKKAEEMFGWSKDEALGRTLSGTIIPRKYRQAHLRGLARFIETGGGRMVGKNVEVIALRRDGTEFPIEIAVSATARSGAQVAFVAFITDISQRRTAEMLRSAQFAVTRPLAEAASWAEAAPRVLQGICETLGWSVGEFWTVDREASVLRLEQSWHRPGRELQGFESVSREVTVTRGVGLLGRVWQTGRAHALREITSERDSPRAGAAWRAGLRGKAAFAITNGKRVTGVIGLWSAEPRALDRATLRVMTDMGSQIGQFIERRRAEDELRRSGDRIRAILDNVADGIITVDERLIIRSYNPAAVRLFGYTPEDVIGKEFAHLIADPYRSEIRPQLRSYLRPANTDVLLGSHETIGQRQDGTTFPMEFNVGRLGPQRLLVGSLRDVSERKAETEALQYRALHDQLTSLPNRTFLQERLEEAIHAGEREMKPCALLLMDLDGFKQINDSLGHQAGDDVLQQVSTRMRAVLRRADTIARYGGDEFAVVPWGATDVSRAVLVAEKILQEVDRPFAVGTATVNVSVSVGIAVFPQHAEDAASLMRRADVAMYAAKRAKSGYSVYSVDQDGGEDAGRAPLIGKLRYAIDQFELLLHYQPIVSLRDGRPVKVEALVRWGHPNHGLLPPDDFIPSAEQSDLIKPLTAWVLNEALGQVHAWSRAGIDIGVSVNLSARNLHDTELPDAVAELLRTWQVAPGKLTVEITERGVVAVEALEILQRLHAIGVRISLDDFGTGYSALAYLQHLPVDEIKIDKTFVQDMATNGDQATIVRSTIDLGHNLGLTVVAEGVEDEATYARLAEYGCDLIQGYHLSRPATAAALGPWLRSRGGRSGVLSA